MHGFFIKKEVGKKKTTDDKRRRPFEMFEANKRGVCVFNARICAWVSLRGLLMHFM